MIIKQIPLNVIIQDNLKGKLDFKSPCTGLKTLKWMPAVF